MSEAGLDVMAFKAYSCRMASTSKVALLGVNIQEILDMVDWSNASTFLKQLAKTYISNIITTTKHLVDKTQNIQL
jgi:hypothetical protein